MKNVDTMLAVVAFLGWDLRRWWEKHQSRRNRRPATQVGEHYAHGWLAEE